jgi:two-component system cell cycle sensor histidine kinase/response regulator CckA
VTLPPTQARAADQVTPPTDRGLGLRAAGQLDGRPVDVLIDREVLLNSEMLRNSDVLLDSDALEPALEPQVGGRADREVATTFVAHVEMTVTTDVRGGLLVRIAPHGAASSEPRDVPAESPLLLAEVKRLEVQRLEVQRLESLGQLAGGVAHDFNNLLGVIRNYTTLVARRVSDPIASADLEEIDAAAERGAALTRQLLTFARRDRAHAEPLDVVDVVRGVASMLERTLGEHIDLSLALSPDPVIGVCDRTQLEQILLNLAINARDAMPDGGTLRIAATSSAPAGGNEPAAAVLSVSDTGHGMTAEVLARAFEPFFTTKPPERGTGIGLATVQEIVTNNRGRVAIESVPDEGTTVTVWLSGAAGLATPSSSSDSVVAVGGAERILLVEDKEALRRATARLLVEHGYDVLVAADGVEALEILELDQHGIDLVLTDVAMPRMRGDELADRLLALGMMLPVIFMTGYDTGLTPITGRLLAKPVPAAELLLAVREALDV